jgi:hypothetical protein
MDGYTLACCDICIGPLLDAESDSRRSALGDDNTPLIAPFVDDRRFLLPGSDDNDDNEDEDGDDKRFISDGSIRVSNARILLNMRRNTKRAIDSSNIMVNHSVIPVPLVYIQQYCYSLS